MKKKKLNNITQSYDKWMLASLEDKTEAALYLQVALDEFQEGGDIEVLMLAIRRIAEAQGGIGRLAEKTNLNRESLYKTLSAKGNPKLQTLGILLTALGFHLTVKCA